MAKKNEVIATFGAEDKSGNAITSARARLKELKQEMTALALAGKQNTDQFRALAQEAGELNDTMGDVSQTIKNVGSDTKNIEVFSEAVRGVAAGFAIAQGSAALFGEENEELQKVLVQVQGSMALLNGVTEIANLLQAESQIMIKANAIALGIYNGILRITGTTAATATISLRAFKIALATTGIGALVVGIAYFVEAMNKANKATKDATKAREDFENSKTNTEARLKQFDNETTIIVNGLRLRNESEIKIAKTIEERIRLRNVETKQIIADYQNEVTRLLGSVKEYQKAIDDKKQAQIKFAEWEKTYGKQRDEFLRRGGARGGGGQQYRNPYTEAANADVSEATKEVGKITQEVLKLQNEIKDLNDNIIITTQEGKLATNLAIKNAGKDAGKTAEDNLNDVKNFIEEAKRIVRDANEEEKQKELNAIDDKYTEIGKKVIEGSEQEKELKKLKQQEIGAVEQKYLIQNNQKYIEFIKGQNLALQKEGKTQSEQAIIDLENEFNELTKLFLEGSAERIALEKILADRILAIRKKANQDQADEDKKSAAQRQVDFVNRVKTLSEQVDAAVQATKDRTFDLMQTGVSSVFGAIDNIITGTAGKSEAAQKNAFEKSKKFALAETILSTYLSAQKAAESQLNSKPTTADAPIRAGIAAALQVVAGIGRFVKIQATQYESPSASGSGSTPTGSVSGGTIGMLPPQFGGGSTSPNGSLGNLTNPNSNNAQGTNDNQNGIQPIRAYVVERDITQTNTRIQRIQEFATLGN